MSAYGKLRFGPYRAPQFEYGDVVIDSVRGEVVIDRVSDAKIPWPIGMRGGARSPVVFGDLERAIRNEANVAVCHWWGITPQTVTKWRKALGVETVNAGTSAVRSDMMTPAKKEAMKVRREPKYRDPERNEKIRQSRLGKPRPKHVIEALRRSNLGRKTPPEALQRQHEARQRRFPTNHAPWTTVEDEIVRTHSIQAAAKATGRSISRIERRRAELGITKPKARNPAD